MTIQYKVMNYIIFDKFGQKNRPCVVGIYKETVLQIWSCCIEMFTSSGMILTPRETLSSVWFNEEVMESLEYI